jgi:hypothetical protein
MKSGGQLVPLKRDSHPGRADIAEISGASRTALALLPNLLVQLDHGARMEIIRLTVTKDGNETGNAMLGRNAEVKLTAGRMVASHDWGNARARFSVITPQGELLTTSNALFCLEADETKTRLTCASGSVDFKPRGADGFTTVAPGFVGEWSASASTVTPADAEKRGQDALQESLEIEQRLRALLNQNRNALPR